MIKKIVNTKRARLINLKVAPSEFKVFTTKARKYTGGNISAWIRYAGTELTPRATDLTRARKLHAVQRTVTHAPAKTRVVARRRIGVKSKLSASRKAA